MTKIFEIGDRVRFLETTGFAAEFGAEAIVTNNRGPYLRVQWDRADPRHHNQNDGGYRYASFERVAPVVVPKATRTYDLGSQNGRILAHLLSGNTITPLVAVGVFGAYRLAARIRELREAGHKIKTTIKRDPNGKPYAEYSLRNAGRV